MRRFACLVGLLVLATVSAAAQDNSKVDIFGGYMYLRFSPNISGSGISSVNFNGGVGSVSYNPSKWIGIVGEIAGYHAGTIKSNGVAMPDTTSNAVTYLFGPKIFKSVGKLTPFAQVLFGGVHVSVSTPPPTPESENGFAMALGGGLDWNASHHIGVRLGQIEYAMTRFPNTANGFLSGTTGTQNNFRYAAGVVFRF